MHAKVYMMGKSYCLSNKFAYLIRIRFLALKLTLRKFKILFSECTPD